MKNLSLTLLFLLLRIASYGQLNSHLLVHLAFDQQRIADESAYFNTAFHNGDTVFTCGVVDDALIFDGAQNFITLIGDIAVNRLTTTDFSVSFNFKPSPGSGTYDVLSKRDQCDANRAFSVTYTPNTGILEVLLSENASKESRISHRLQSNRCWYHILIIRRGNKTLLYVDGNFITETDAGSRVNVKNNSSFNVAASPCLGSGVVRFRGALDDLRIYDRAVTPADIALLYVPRDLILNRDTIIYLNQTFNARVSPTCASTFAWTPALEVSNPTIAEPVIAPTQDRVFQLAFIQDGCTALDQVAVEIVDPATLDCEKLLLPTAFTPNGDFLNEEYGISNPLAIDALAFFDIYDRWGTRVFSTNDAFVRWDGTYKGQPMMPGVFMYKASYTCKGESFDKIGSFSLIR